MALTEKLTAIADAIRGKTGGTDGLTLDGMVTAIEGISTGFPNGTEWTPCNGISGRSFHQITEVKGRYFACDDNITYYSDDGMTWTYDYTNNVHPQYINYDNGIFVGVCSDGILYSDNGTKWTQSNITSLSSSIYSKPIYGDGVWVAAGYNGVYYSSDGKTWTMCEIDASLGSCCVEFAKGTWVLTTQYSGFWYSADGVSWSQSNISNVNARYPTNADGIWVATVVSGGFYYSTDGQTWTQSNITDATARSIKYAVGLWQIASSKGLYYSTDAKTWKNSKSDVTYSSVAYGCGIWVASPLYGKGKNLIYSYDGVNWLSTTTKSLINDDTLLWANGIWLAGENNGTILYSVTWKPST